MNCECGGASQVLETRRHADQIRRRRRCLRCRRIWMTIEVGTTDVRRLLMPMAEMLSSMQPLVHGVAES